jgi:hypothetical protein
MRKRSQAARPEFLKERTPLGRRLARIDWCAAEARLRDRGHAAIGPLLEAGECRHLIRLYDEAGRFRSQVQMEHHRFGAGQYRYFAEPLPEPVASLREHLYAALAPAARRWMRDLREAADFPDDLAGFRERCAAAGQTRPTPLLLRYSRDGYNCLHRDVYGEVAFPFQLLVVLSRPGADFTGGEFLLVEQRPRAQSAGEALSPARGEGLLFANQARPAVGKRGHHRVVLRHGVSRIRSGKRIALGVIFHDAR